MKAFINGFYISYDEFSDVLYISVGHPKKAKSFLDQDYVLVRKIDDEICGLTIEGIRSRLIDHTWNKQLILRYLPDFNITDLNAIELDSLDPYENLAEG